MWNLDKTNRTKQTQDFMVYKQWINTTKISRYSAKNILLYDASIMENILGAVFSQNIYKIYHLYRYLSLSSAIEKMKKFKMIFSAFTHQIRKKQPKYFTMERKRICLRKMLLFITSFTLSTLNLILYRTQSGSNAWSMIT